MLYGGVTNVTNLTNVTNVTSVTNRHESEIESCFSV